MNNTSKVGLLLSILITFLIVTRVVAGGGGVQPINFAHAQAIPGKSFNPEVAIKDPATNYETVLVGKSFHFEALKTLAGATCETTQGVSDNQGRVKANCRADVYGKFSFNLIETQTSLVHASFDVYFTENGTGFPDQGSQGVYTISIAQGNFIADIHTPFILEAVLKKDGQITNNYEAINFFKWEVLDGSLISLSSKVPKNRVVEFRSDKLGTIHLRVVAVLNDGSTAESGAIQITTMPIFKGEPTPISTSIPNPTIHIPKKLNGDHLPSPTTTSFPLPPLPDLPALPPLEPKFDNGIPQSSFPLRKMVNHFKSFFVKLIGP